MEATNPRSANPSTAKPPDANWYTVLHFKPEVSHLNLQRMTMAVVRETREVLYPTVYKAFTDT